MLGNTALSRYANRIAKEKFNMIYFLKFTCKPQKTVVVFYAQFKQEENDPRRIIRNCTYFKKQRKL